MNNDWREYYDPQYVLMHHGIRGHKWGVRRYEKESGGLTAAGKAKMSAIGNKDAKKTESYKSAAKAYRKQVGSDLFYGRSGTTLNYAVDAASKKRG